jgi:hypothetical protein
MPLLSATRKRLLWLTVFAVAMAQLEAAVVVYLRQLFYPQGFTFPLVIVTGRLLWVEIGREASTILMLAAAGVLSSADRWRRFASFMLLFGVWDIFYYVWLYVLLRWPSSLGTRDLLFLMPGEWWAPVWEPLLASCAFIAGAVLILLRSPADPVPRGARRHA